MMFQKTLLTLLLLIIGGTFPLLAQSSTAPESNNISSPVNLNIKKSYTTQAITDLVPSIDGDLNDPAWEKVAWGGGDFVQRQPYEGKDPSVETAFKILYDAKNLYVAFRCFDSEPDKIQKRLSRRDGFEGDWVEINIDSYHDLRTAFSFTISVSGVKGDEFISNDGRNWDASWDPIWYAKTKIDKEGWTAEVRIPLSQLRFPNQEEHIWGIQFTRRYFQKEERSSWQYVPLNSSQWVSAFGELRGLKGIKPQKQVEILPYVVAQIQTFEREVGNPFATGIRPGLSAGIDGKIGVTSDLTLDFTINPDFGQVEADPSALVLDGFQVFFEERRPFFIGNRNIFDFRLTQSEAGGPFGSDILFYSRRIGGSPHGYPSLEDGEYVDFPQNTSILGAAKFSGRTQRGLSIGILESVTQEEYAKIDYKGDRRKEAVEPLSSYFIGRVQQDFRGGNTVIGGMLTAVNRKLDGTGLDFLHQSAYTGGLDFLHRWKDQLWYLAGNTVFSQVAGSEEAIGLTQEAFSHNFQRVDAPHLRVDTSLTSLAGNGGSLRLGKTGGGKRFNFEGGLTWRSPKLELNDVGFLRNTDDLTHFFWCNYRIDQPFSIFRSWRFNYNHWTSWDYSGLHTFLAWNMNAHAMFKNNYGVGSGFNYFPFDISTKALRGGPSLRLGKGINNWAYLFTDSRKKIQFNFNIFNQWGIDNENRSQSYDVYMTFTPINALQVSVGPGLSINHDVLQYVENVELENETRYLNATIDQKTLSATVNLNFTVNPNLTVQYYGSPFISRGRYSDFKYITDSRNAPFAERFYTYTDDQVQYSSEEEIYRFDENRDGSTTFSIDNPDFNFMQFRSNLVIRWEYIPGSELFLVWSQGNTNTGDPKDRLIPSLVENLFRKKANNTFLIKYTYRFIR